MRTAAMYSSRASYWPPLTACHGALTSATAAYVHDASCFDMLWDMDMDGIDDPEAGANRYLGMGDYRPHRWHVPFDYYRDQPDAPSMLR